MGYQLISYDVLLLYVCVEGGMLLLVSIVLRGGLLTGRW